MRMPNLVFVFADQMRYDAAGFAGNTFVSTPNLDRLAREGQNFTHAISGFPVCGPWRASLLTGRYPLSHGVIINDIALPTELPSFGQQLKQAGYRTGYIGKWHLDGPNRGCFTPPGERRRGFDFWAVANCTHTYSKSLYYRDTPEPLYWEGYDALAQTTCAIDFIRAQADPYALFLSWGPPHNPYRDVPQKYLDMYPRDRVQPRPNCPNPNLDELCGYYAHVTALDEQVGRLLAAIDESGQRDNTIFVFTSDHGDMLGSHGMARKQLPWEESIHVPFLIRAPMQARNGENQTLLNVWDMMPTLLSLMDVEVPDGVQGLDLSDAVRRSAFEGPPSTLAAAVSPFCEYLGEGWRAVRTHRHTYVRQSSGPWLLYDNERDPYQLENLAGRAEHAPLQAQLEAELQRHLKTFNDDFAPADEYPRRYGLSVDRVRQIPTRFEVGKSE